MPENNFTKPVILVSNLHGSGKGIYKSEDDEFIVEVFKKVGYSTYSYKLNGKLIGKQHVMAENAWEEIGEYLSAILIPTDRKFINNQIKFLQEK